MYLTTSRPDHVVTPWSCWGSVKLGLRLSWR